MRPRPVLHDADTETNNAVSRREHPRPHLDTFDISVLFCSSVFRVLCVTLWTSSSARQPGRLLTSRHRFDVIAGRKTKNALLSVWVDMGQSRVSSEPLGPIAGVASEATATRRFTNFVLYLYYCHWQ